jgi:L-asparaginase
MTALNTPRAVRLIATGGTFDKVYDPIAGALGFGQTHLHAMIQRARIGGAVSVETALMMDSLEMDDSHRTIILDRCRAATEPAIVVIHGTDTMVETARVLGAANLARTIVLTGAMIPYQISDSDALFNLGHAIGCARLLGPGVWVAMNGVAHSFDAVRKNRSSGYFEAVA